LSSRCVPSNPRGSQQCPKANVHKSKRVPRPCHLVLTYLENVKDKKVVLYGVQLGMAELRKWQVEEKDTL